MTLSISNLETIDTSQAWRQSGVRVDIGSSVATFEEETDAEDAVKAMMSVDDTLEIIKAAKRWAKARKNPDVVEFNATSQALMELIDGISP